MAQDFPHTSSRACSASPFVINVAKLGRRPGTMIHFQEQRIATEPIGLDLMSIRPGEPIDINVRLESVSEGILVTGLIYAPTCGECVRCLRPISSDIEVNITELFAYPHSTTDATTDDQELGRVVDDTIDLYQAIIDAVGLELPLSPLCSPHCLGLCPQCGVVLAETDPDHHHDTIDPRWAQLAHIKDRLSPQDTTR